MTLDFLKDEPYVQGTLSAFAKDKKIAESEVLQEPHIRDFLGVLSLPDRFRFFSRAIKAFPEQPLFLTLLLSHFSAISIGDRLRAFDAIKDTGNYSLFFTLLVQIRKQFDASALHPVLESLKKEDISKILEAVSQVEKPEELEVKEILKRFHPKPRWIPSTDLLSRILRMRSEFWANLPSEQWGGESPFIYAQTPERRKEVLKWIYEHTSDPVWVRQYLSVLEYPEDSGRRWIEALDCTGGLLNLFRGIASLAISEEGEKKPSDRTDEPSGESGDWNHTPLKEWNGLSPAMLLAGGGPVENQLLMEFLHKAEQELKEPGDEKAAELFRTWVETLGKGGKPPRQMILEERQKLVLLREQFRKEKEAFLPFHREKRKKKEKPRRR